MTASMAMEDYFEIEEWFADCEYANVDDSGSAQVLYDPDDENVVARFSTWDTAYKDWAYHVFYNACYSVHLPKMYAFEEHPNGDSYVVVMEMLEHMSYGDALWTLCERHWNERWIDVYGDGDAEQALAEIRDEYAGYERLELITLELLELQAETHDECYAFNHRMDLHEFNVMIRRGRRRDEKGRFCKCEDVAVITDPWC